MIVDFHSHILPNIDDGSKNSEMSKEMLEMISHQNVDIQILTPHFYANRYHLNKYLDQRKRMYETLLEDVKTYDFNVPELYLGAEVAFFEGMSHASGLDDLTINHSKVLLVEMPFYKWTQSVIDEIVELIDKRHFIVIIAHIERYFSLGYTTKKYIKQLLELPVYIQINAESIEDKNVAKLLKKGQVHVLGSDAHNLTTRKPNLEKGRLLIEKKFGKDVLAQIDSHSNELIMRIRNEI